MQQSVCIKYGIGEGDWHGKLFREALSRTGYRVTRDAEAADIIISHSGGCFFLPRTRQEQVIVLINPPYWPGKPLLVSVWQKIWWDCKAFAKCDNIPGFILKTAWNTVHLIRYIGISLKISWSAKKRNFYQAINNETVFIIRNDQDAWCSPDIQRQLEPHKKFIVIELPGQHDDCWADPEPYIKVIQSELAKLKMEKRSK